MNKDINYMQRALELALKGAGRVSPNPMVGAVIVKSGKIIGEGWHDKFGGAHAEVNAVRNAAESVAGSTIYVTLEPCSYHGKTPACAPMLVNEGFRRVVIGTLDPNPRVSGNGIKILRNAGIDVTIGVEEPAARRLIQPFIKSMTGQLPYIVLKSAITLDGFIADEHGDSKWISSEASRKMVHQWRCEMDAVMVGANTVIADDPLLTVRAVDGRNPKRIIVDLHGRIPVQAQIVKSAADIETLIIIQEEIWQASALRHTNLQPVFNKNQTVKWPEALTVIHERGIQTVLVEGGAYLQNSLLKDGYIDRLELFIAPKMVGKGHRMMEFLPEPMNRSERFVNHQWRVIGDDVLFTGIIREY